MEAELVYDLWIASDNYHRIYGLSVDNGNSQQRPGGDLMNARIRISMAVTICLLLICLSAIAQEGLIVRETVHSSSLEGNLLGDSPDRQVTIYLPPSYDNGDNLSYPVVYLLHGYTGDHNSWAGGYVGDILYPMNSWLRDGKAGEMILVMPNSYNKLQGSFYTNSVTTGKWEDFIARDLVLYIDSNYRTLPQRESRAVIGHSMGGYGGLKLGLLYPEVFGCLGGMAGVYDVGDWITSRESMWANASNIKTWAQFYSLGWQEKSPFAWNAAFVPNPDNPPFYCDFPLVYTDTEPRKVVNNQDVYDRFMAHDILRMAEGYVTSLSGMEAIYIDCGVNDQFNLIEDARKLHDKLLSLGVDHIYREFSGDHTNHVMTSTGDALEVFSNAMAFEMLVGVEPAGKLAVTWAEIRSR